MIVDLRVFTIVFCFVYSLQAFSSIKDCSALFPKKDINAGEEDQKAGLVTVQLKDQDAKQPDYITIPARDRNDISALLKDLSVSQGDGAVVLNINPFTYRIAEKIRQAINALNQPRLSSDDPYLAGVVISRTVYKENWLKFKNRLLSETNVVSAKEIDQFRMELDQYFDEVRQTILEMDGKDTYMSYFIIRTEELGIFQKGHVHNDHKEESDYLISNIAPIGSNTYYFKQINGEAKKVIPAPGSTVFLSEWGRVRTLSEEGSPVEHGTPFKKEDRLLIIGAFKKKL